MSIDRTRLRWNGWGWLEGLDVLGERAEPVWEWIGRSVGVEPLPKTPAMPLESIPLPASRLCAGDYSALASAGFGADRLKTDAFERAYHARGRSYHDLLYLRAGHLETAPDAVVYPVSTDETLALVKVADTRRIALVPFGGGSSVVGGVTATLGAACSAVITVDMTHMDQLIDIDETSLIARAQAGIYGPDLEKALQARGYTLGHYPQSFEFSTLGGWIAPRSAGHQSNKYGKAEEWLVSATLATPRGLWSTEAFPGSAAGPQFRDIVTGSEGVLGIITEAEFRVHRVPEVKDYRGYVIPGFANGVEVVRALVQADLGAASLRLSDESETFFYNGLDAGGVKVNTPAKFCLLLVGLEGEASEVASALERSKAIIKARGGIHMGEALGQKWYTTRFETPYLRDPMLDRGLGVDTLETATRWSNLLPLYTAVSTALTEALEREAAIPGARGIVMAHLSHSYRDGASLYYTFAFPRALDREVEQWKAVKAAASDAIRAHGGTISHHHGVGEDHRSWLASEKGPIAMGALHALKRELDPTGIMNPGKLISC